MHPYPPARAERQIVEMPTLYYRLVIGWVIVTTLPGARRRSRQSSSRRSARAPVTFSAEDGAARASDRAELVELGIKRLTVGRDASVTEEEFFVFSLDISYGKPIDQQWKREFVEKFFEL